MTRTPSPGLSLELVIGATPLVTLVSSAVAAQSLGPTGRGLLSTITVWSQGVALLAFLSLDKGALSLGRESETGAPSGGVLRASLRSDVFALTLFAGISGAVVTGLLSGRWWVAGAVGAASALLCRAEWSAGLAMVDDRWAAFKAWRIVQPMAFAFGVLLTALAGHSLPQEQRTAAMAAGFVISVMVGLTLLRASNRREGVASASVRRQVWRFASRYHITTGASLLASRMDLLLAPALLTFAQVGQYAVAAAGGAVLTTVGSAALLRGLTETPGASSRPRLAPLMMILLVAGVGILAMPLLVPLVFGSQFRPAIGPGQVLLAAGALGYLTQWQTGRMAACGLPGWAALPQVATAVIVLTVGLLTRDVIGLAIGVVLGRVVALAVGLVAVAVLRPHTASASQCSVASTSATETYRRSTP